MIIMFVKCLNHRPFGKDIIWNVGRACTNLLVLVVRNIQTYAYYLLSITI